MKRLLAALGIVLLTGSTAMATWPCCFRPPAVAPSPVVVQSPVGFYAPLIAPEPPPLPVNYHYGPIKRVVTYSVPVAAPPVTMFRMPYPAAVAPSAGCATCQPAYRPVPLTFP